MSKWRVSVYCIQYCSEGEYIWSIPDDTFEVATYEEAVRRQKAILAGEGYEDQEVHRCEISEVT